MGTLRRTSERDMSPAEGVDEMPPRNAIDPALENEHQERRREDELQSNRSNGAEGHPYPLPNVYPGPYPTPHHTGYWPPPKPYAEMGPPAPPPGVYYEHHYYDHRKPAPYPPPHTASRYAHHLPPPAPQGPPPGPAGDHYPAPYEPYLQITYTEDSSTKLSDRVRRRCFNCYTTDTSTWRRSTLTPGKVLCNKCGLFERTHRRQRPEHIAQEKGKRTPANDAPPRRDRRDSASASGSGDPLTPPPPPMSAQHSTAPVPMMTYSLPPPLPNQEMRRYESYNSGPTLAPLVNQRADTPISSARDSPPAPRASPKSPPHRERSLSPSDS